ncbi:MAG TPA: sigma-70 family RNA polymerase sigma factor [Anaerolineae bacterium]
MDERTCIASAQKGDVPAFNQLVRAYQGLVYHTAYRVLGEPESASDAAQDAFISAFKHLKEFRGGSFKAWLLRIVTNACYDQLRAKQRKPTASLDALLNDPDKPSPGIDQSTAESPQDHAERRELGALLTKAIQSLPIDQRIAVVLSDIDGLTYEEIAEATGTNIGTVKSRLSRARALMREVLLANEELLPSRYRLKGTPTRA